MTRVLHSAKISNVDNVRYNDKLKLCYNFVIFMLKPYLAAAVKYDVLATENLQLT